MRAPKPYFKKSHNAWYANIGPDKRPVRLASEAEGEAKAYERYYQIMADRQPVAPDSPVVELLDRYLEHCHDDLAESTYRNRRRTLESFARHIGSKLKVSALKPHHVSNWIKQYKETSPTHR